MLNQFFIARATFLLKYGIYMQRNGIYTLHWIDLPDNVKCGFINIYKPCFLLDVWITDRNYSEQFVNFTLILHFLNFMYQVRMQMDILTCTMYTCIRCKRYCVSYCLFYYIYIYIHILLIKCFYSTYYFDSGVFLLQHRWCSSSVQWKDVVSSVVYNCHVLILNFYKNNACRFWTHYFILKQF